MAIQIFKSKTNFEREPLIRPFGFKGGYVTEIWQSIVRVQSWNGLQSLGLCTQNALWSDSAVFAENSPSAAEAMMYLITEYALARAEKVSWNDPIELQQQIFDDVYSYAVRVTRESNLRKTFALNALVGVDFAAWILYAKENNFTTFEEMLPPRYRPALPQKHSRVAAIPLMAYAVPVNEIVKAVEDGYFFMKIKIGQPGSQQEMLEKDKTRLLEIHNAIGSYRTEYTKSGKLPYYLDANGRYESKRMLQRFLDYAAEIGALEQIALIEEPFPEEYKESVADLPVRIAADESAHTDVDTLERIELGYRAIALKPIAKTLSMTLKIAALAHARGIPCFCADLTVNPVLVDWNKLIAARLDTFPGLENMGLLETNGHQNYADWKQMQSYLPLKDQSWQQINKGIFELDDNFYSENAGIFLESEHYAGLV